MNTLGILSPSAEYVLDDSAHGFYVRVRSVIRAPVLCLIREGLSFQTLAR